MEEETDAEKNIVDAFDETIEPPKIEDSIASSTKKKSKTVIFGAVAVAVAMVFAIIMNIYSSTTKKATPVYSSNVSSEASGFDRTKAGEGTVNPEAARIEAEAVAQRAEEARKKGGSFISTEHFGDAPDKAAETKVPGQEPAATEGDSAQPMLPPPPPVENPQGQGDKTASPVKMVIDQLFKSGKPGFSAGQAVAVQSPAAYSGQASGGAQAPINHDITAGQMFGAVMTLGMNSLVPETPARAVITSGKYRGAVCIGSIKNKSNRYLVANFNQMSIGSKTYPIDAIAVNMEDYQAGLADEVNSRFFERYALMAGTGFLQGVGSAFLSSGTTTTQSTGTTGNILTQTNPSRTTQDAMLIGLGGAAQAISPMAQEIHADIRPEVKVYANKEIGIVMLKPVSFSAPQKL